VYREPRWADHSLPAINSGAFNVPVVKRLFPLVLAFVVACGGSTTTDSTDVTTSTNSTAQQATTTTEPGSSTTAPAGSSSTTSGRQVAPDFTLELGDGGEFVLSEGAKPVYLVFWAEW